jgi:hypothetical protein
MAKKEVTMRRREMIVKDETKVFGDKIFYDLHGVSSLLNND